MKKLFVLLTLATCAAGLSFAAPKKRVVKKKAAPAASQSTAKVDDVSQPKKRTASEAFQAWLKEMKKRIQKTNTKPNQIVAVAAVRGNEVPDSPPLYWKGKKAEGKVDAFEMKDFSPAIDPASKGEGEAAKKQLQAFMDAYPKSSLMADAKETMNRLSAAETPAAQ